MTELMNAKSSTDRIRNVTIRDVAFKAGVSLKTVSNVVNNRRVVKAVTRERVLRAIEDLDYRPSAAARALVTRSRRLISLLVSDVTNPAYPEMVEVVAEMARLKGYMLLLCNTGRDPVEESFYLNLITEQQADGVIISSCTAESRAVDVLLKRGIKVVLFNRRPARYSVNYVGVDNVGGGYDATIHLITTGHRRIAFMRGEAGASTSDERETGYRRALAESGITVDESLIVMGDYRTEVASQASIELLTRKDPPSAVFAANDVMALAVIDKANRFGLRVPEDLAVIGFDDIAIASNSRIGLSTVRSDLRNLAGEATQLLFELIANPEHPGNANPTNKILPVSLQIRLTCGALKD
ncbi:MAG: LacI family DNA-binding transcriptional regulator [Spirochaetia bacterium]|jgi:LacI family transcriptional regulator